MLQLVIRWNWILPLVIDMSSNQAHWDGAYADVETTSAALSRSGAALVYSGNSQPEAY